MIKSKYTINQEITFKQSFGVFKKGRVTEILLHINEENRIIEERYVLEYRNKRGVLDKCEVTVEDIFLLPPVEDDMPQRKKKWYVIKEAAAMLGISNQLLVGSYKRGLINGTIIEHKLHFTEYDIKDFEVADYKHHTLTAKELGVNTQRLAWMRITGVIKGVKAGEDYYYTKAERERVKKAI